MNNERTALLAGLLLLALACGSGGGDSKGTPEPPGPPVPPQPGPALAIEKVEPSQAVPGAAITLTGPGLGKAYSVWFAGPAMAPFERLDDQRLKVTVPPFARTGRIEANALGHAPAQSKDEFKIIQPPPTLDRLEPAVGRPGYYTYIYGKNLSGTTDVTFGGISAGAGVGHDSFRLVKVPDQARSGEVTARTPGGVARFQDYKITSGGHSHPEILNLQPDSGPVGTLVKISGNDLVGLDRVDFSGTPAAAVEATPTYVTAKVPPGTQTGGVRLLHPDGRSFSSGYVFTVTSGAPDLPAIHSFEPESGPPLQLVILTGPGLGTLTKATLGGLACSTFSWGGDRVYLFIPPSSQNPRSAPLVLTLPGGQELRTERPFHVVTGRPVITAIEPESGPAGTPVRVWGRNLEPIQSVTIGDTPAPHIQYPSTREFLVELPANCTGGKIKVVTAGGEATSDQAFTRVEGASALTVTIAKVQLTQGMQNPDGTLPLVRGRAGYLRAFVQANAPNQAAPSVRITIRNAAGAEVLDQVIPAPSQAGVPVHILDDQLAATWNLGLPARAFEPGNTLVAQLVWNGTPPALGPAPASFPHDGQPLALDVRTVPPFHLVLRPIRANGVLGHVVAPGRTLEDWTDQLRAMYPLAQVEAVEGQPFETTFALGSDANDYNRVVQALEVARKLAPGSQWHYWYGVFDQPANGTLNGIAAGFGTPGNSDSRTAIGFSGDRRETGGSWFANTMAHELGHCMGRYHAPCGGAYGPDEHYPHPEAGLGGAGLHVGEGKLISPEIYKDIMGYCYPRWSSDYTYKAILDFRAQDPLPQAEHAARSLRPNCLLVWGRIHDGRLELEPAFQAPLEPSRPEPGDYRLKLRNAQGAVLEEVSFAAREVPDLPGDIRSFMLAIPCPARLAESLATLEVVHDGRVLGTLRAPDSARIADRREPVAVPWGPGKVHLGWDHGTWPTVIVRDPATGEVLSLASGGSVELTTRLPELELLMSDGLRTLVRKVRVQAH